MRECRQCDVAAWFRGGSAEAKGRARRRWNEATNAGREMPWLGIIVATLYALEYESRIPTDRGTITETGNTPVFEPRGHPRVDHQVIRNDSSSSSSSSRFFPLSPRNGSSRRAIEREPICIPHRYAKKECLRHPRHPRRRPIPLSRNEAHFRRRAHSFEIEPRYDRGKGHHLVANGRINVSSYRGPGRGIGSTDAQVSE